MRDSFGPEGELRRKPPGGGGGERKGRGARGREGLALLPPLASKPVIHGMTTHDKLYEMPFFLLLFLDCVLGTVNRPCLSFRIGNIAFCQGTNDDLQHDQKATPAVIIVASVQYKRLFWARTPCGSTI